MDKQTATLVEALRLARLELDCYRDPACRATPEWTVARLTELLLDDREVSHAMATVLPEAEAPSIVMEDFNALETAC